MQISREQRKKKTMVCVTQQAMGDAIAAECVLRSELNLKLLSIYCTSIKNSCNDIGSALY
jgi:hypothetical protein